MGSLVRAQEGEQNEAESESESDLLRFFYAMNFVVYILYSKKINRYYTGMSGNLDERLDFHRDPEARKFTARADDWEVFHVINCYSKKQALAIEAHIKRMRSATYKLNLQKYPEMNLKLLSLYKD